MLDLWRISGPSFCFPFELRIPSRIYSKLLRMLKSMEGEDIYKFIRWLLAAESPFIGNLPRAPSRARARESDMNNIVCVSDLAGPQISGEAIDPVIIFIPPCSYLKICPCVSGLGLVLVLGQTEATSHSVLLRVSAWSLGGFLSQTAPQYFCGDELFGGVVCGS